MLTNIVLLGLLTTTPTPRVPVYGAYTMRPRIEVWSNHGDAVYSRGQGVRIYIRTDQDAFVTLFRIDTDGRVRVLFPRDPWEDNFVRGGRDFEIMGSDNHRTTFYIDDYAGVGYLFGIAAADPFDYTAIESGSHWDYRTIADGRVRGDPYVALTEIAERIVPENYADWDYDIVPYYVEQRYEYPRFLCYDCHTYASYRYWDPYWRSCVRFRIVYYNDPYYYPYRYYGNRVVFVRPYRPQPRYVFKDRDGTGRDQFVTREANRPLNDDTRRAAPDRRSTTSFIPTPRERPQGLNSAEEVRGAGRGTVAGREQTSDNDRGTRREPNRADNDRSSAGNQADADRPASGDGQPRGTRVVPDKTRAQPSSRGNPIRELLPRESRGNDRAEPSRGEQSRAEPRGTPQRESRTEPRATPQREAPQREAPRAERPRSEAKPQPQPRASEPKSSGSGDKAQPELRRRKPE